MARLSVCLFGSFETTLDGQPVTGFASDKVRALLTYLAVESDRPHRRESLCGLLWPDYPEASARANLRRALANLRTVIDDRCASPPFLSISRQTVQFNDNSDAWCDVTAFVGAIEFAHTSPQAIPRLEEAVGLYRGSLLEGFSLADSVAFEEWLLLERERLRRQVLVALRQLAAHYQVQGKYRRALPYARQQVELEPWHEEAQRQLMRLLALDGQRGLAVAQYQACRRILADQLGVEPAAETTRLYEQICAGHDDLEPAPQRAVAHEHGEAEGMPAPPTIPNRPSRRRTTGLGLALAGGTLLLLAVVVMQVLIFFGLTSPPEATLAPENLIAAPRGKLVIICPDLAPPQICVQALPAGELTQVTDDLDFTELDAPAWSPDGQQIVVAAGEPLDAPQSSGLQLHILAADGSHVRQITRGDVPSLLPNWSPDGEWIAFNRGQQLWLVRPDGSEPHRVYGEPGRLCVGELGWSPDSQRIAFLGWPCSPPPLPPTPEVWVLDREGSDARVVYAFPQPPASAALYWEPDGTGLVCEYERGAEGSRFLHLNPEGLREPFLIDILPGDWKPNYWPQWGRLQELDH